MEMTSTPLAKKFMHPSFTSVIYFLPTSTPINNTHIHQKGGLLMVAQWLRYCATNRKVAGSIPDGVIEIFH
jgi:hypothetical protein